MNQRISCAGIGKNLAWMGAAALLLTASPGRGEDLKLWPAGAPGALGTEQNDTPTLKVFSAPKGVATPVPAVLLIPGGGYKHISGYGDYLKFFSSRPVRFFSLKYRLPVHGYRHPAPLQDARRAVATLRANAEKWNLDPGRIMVVAFSSGGHVATTLATHQDPGDPAAPDPIDRFSSRPDVSSATARRATRVRFTSSRARTSPVSEHWRTSGSTR